MRTSIHSPQPAVESGRTARSDHGFSLVEILITVAIMGMVATSISLIMTTVFSVAPGINGRVDDTRSHSGLVAYMPEDVNSTPPGNFDFDSTRDSGCTDAGLGVNLVHMTWTEDTGTPTTYMASYRYIDDGSGYQIYRFACQSGDTTTQVRPMTATLPDIDESTWTQGADPVRISQTFNADGVVNGLTLSLDLASGSSVDFEMRTNNPAETLSPLSSTTPTTVVPGNAPPTAAAVAVTTTASDPVTVALPASDPDGDGLVVAVGTLPAGWTDAISGLDLTLTPPGSDAPGFVATVDYSVTDPSGATASSTVTVEIVAAASANNAPTASPVNTTGSTGATTVVNLADYTSDADSDPLTVTWTPEVAPGLDISVTGMEMSITPDGTVTSPAPFDYTVTDPSGASASSTVEISVTGCVVTGLSPATTSVELKKNGRLSTDVSYDVTYTGPCTDLVLEYDNTLDDGSYDPAFLSFGEGTTVTVQGHPRGLTWSPGLHVMTLRDGLAGSAILTSDLELTEK